MSLKHRLIARIAAEGPIGVATFMQACLHDPKDGYYATRPALGEAGDFVTAPLVSQMFGELIGLWAVETWARMGRPSPFRLVEAGPGDGTLFSDLLRAVKLAPDFLSAADLWLVETSQPLRRIQALRLEEEEVSWAGSLAEIPPGAPVILIANELLDCMGADQFLRTEDGWAQIKVGLDSGGDLAFGLVPAPHMPANEGVLAGSVFEICLAQAGFGATLGGLIAREGGAALLIDYGRSNPGFGDTLQAVKDHQKVDPLQTAGEADLTIHVDFPAVARAGEAAGAKAATILTQGEFLRALGIEQRAALLSERHPGHADIITRQFERLTGADQMGELFKVLCLHQAGLAVPGFEEDAP